MSIYADRHQPTPAEALRETWETLRTRVMGMFPAAHTVNIYIDDSHDSPHGHVLTVMDEAGTVIVDAQGEWWQSVNDTILIDEAAYDWFVDYCATNTDKEYAPGTVIAVPIHG